MREQSSIGRRIESAIAAYIAEDYELALIHFFPALDKTAKIRRPNAKVGERIRAFLSDEEDLISFVAFGNVFTNITVSGYTFPQAIYKFGRTSIAHEGELDEHLVIHDGINIEISDVWKLPSSYIFSLITALIVAEENMNEILVTDLQFACQEKTFNVNDLWGQEKHFRDATGLTAIKSRRCK